MTAALGKCHSAEWFSAGGFDTQVARSSSSLLAILDEQRTGVKCKLDRQTGPLENAGPAKPPV
jgi:hypothetical protein